MSQIVGIFPVPKICQYYVKIRVLSEKKLTFSRGIRIIGQSQTVMSKDYFREILCVRETNVGCRSSHVLSALSSVTIP